MNETNNNQEDLQDDEYLSPEERQRRYEKRKAIEQGEYEKGYMFEVNRFTSGLDEDDKQELMSEVMKHHNIRHTGNPEKDARLNLLEAEKIIRGRQASEFDDHCKSYLDYLSKRERKETPRKWAKKVLKGPVPGSLDSNINFKIRENEKGKE